MIRFVVSVIGGASLGGVYALIGLGMVLAYRATETFNLAQGQLMLLPAFTMGYLQSKGHGNFLVQLAVCLGISAVVGLLFYVLVLQRTVGLPVFMGLIATLGIASILDAAMIMKFGANQYAIRVPGLPKGAIKKIGRASCRERV